MRQAECLRKFKQEAELKFRKQINYNKIIKITINLQDLQNIDIKTGPAPTIIIYKLRYKPAYNAVHIEGFRNMATEPNQVIQKPIALQDHIAKSNISLDI